MSERSFDIFLFASLLLLLLAQCSSEIKKDKIERLRKDLAVCQATNSALEVCGHVQE